MPSTRSTKSAAGSSDSASAPTSSSKHKLNSKIGYPSKVFVLPTKASTEAQIVILPNPRTATPARYLACPETGIYEFKKIAAPQSTPRSWLLETTSATSTADVKAEITESADLYLATAIDPVFLLLPALVDCKKSKNDDEKRLFLSTDDYFDKLPEDCSHLSELLRWPSIRKLLEARMAAVCDTVEAGDESMFRVNEKKLLQTVLGKATKMSECPLPPSMEEHFVKRALAAPILLQRRDATSTGTNTASESEVSTPHTESTESQSSTATADTAASSLSQPSTAATSFTEEVPQADGVAKPIEASPEITKLQRTRVAFEFICASYIPQVLVNQLQSQPAASESAVDFTPLDEFLAKLSKLRSEAMVRSDHDFSRKRGYDEELDAAREGKKRKLEEEKKKKANESRGVRDLKKVNTSGMMKLSAFFKKK